MRRRLHAVLALLLAVAVAGPAAAHDFTGSEERKGRKRTVYTNDVRCARGGTDVGGVKVYRRQTSPTSGGLGVCNDGRGQLGSTAPIQGRAAVQGSSNGGSVYADGDKHNRSEQAQGWVRISGSATRGITVRCGDARGRKDATHPTAADRQDDCG